LITIRWNPKQRSVSESSGSI